MKKSKKIDEQTAFTLELLRTIPIQPETITRKKLIEHLTKDPERQHRLMGSASLIPPSVYVGEDDGVFCYFDEHAKEASIEAYLAHRNMCRTYVWS